MFHLRVLPVVLALQFAAQFETHGYSQDAESYCVQIIGGGGTALGSLWGPEPDTGEFGCVVIYCAPANALYDTIPSFAFDLWDTSTIDPALFSVPKYFREVSRGKFRLKVKILTAAGNRAFRAGQFLDNWRFEDADYWPFMVGQILDSADAHVNFADYDLNGNGAGPDGFVDRIVLMCVGTEIPCANQARGAAITASAYHSAFDDTLASGASVFPGRGVFYETHAECASNFVHLGLLVHELGHWFGFPDMYYWKNTAIGSFCGMATRRFYDQYPSPYNPRFLLDKGWLSATTITQPTTNLVVQDLFNVPNQLFKVGAPDVRDKQYFLFDYHQRLCDWERNWPIRGLLIWHVDDSLHAPNYSCRAEHARQWGNRWRKPIDLEYATGLFEPVSTTQLSAIPKPEHGIDSLDLMPSVWSSYPGWGSARVFWKPGINTSFSDFSNPSSAFYCSKGYVDQSLALSEPCGDQTVDLGFSEYSQDLNTGLSITGIWVSEESQLAVVNVNPGSCAPTVLASSTAWTSTVNLDRDFVVPVGVTLTVSPATIIRVNSHSYCTAQSGARNRIIVEGNLIIQGTPSQPVQFRSAAGQPGFCDWEGIVVRPGGTAIVSNASIKHARAGIVFEGESASSVSYCTIDSCDLYGIKSFNPQLRIEHSNFYRVNSGYGVHLRDSCTVFYNTFGEPEVSCRFAPIGLRAENSNALIDSNTFWFRSSVNPPCEINSIAAIEVDGKKSQLQPLLIRRCYIDGYNVGIDIAMKSNVRIEMCDLFCHPSSNPGRIGINDKGSLSEIVVRNSIISGFTTGVHTKSGNIDLGQWDGNQGGGNSIFLNCNHDHTSKATCSDWDTYYRFVTTNAIEGVIKAEGNRWVMPCSTSTCPDPAKVPDILDASPCGGFDYVWCGKPPEKRAIVVADESQPFNFDLAQNFPNPFNPITAITFSIPRPEHVELSVYNLLGQRVAVLVDELREAGIHKVEWDGRDATGREVASGIYFYRISAGNLLQVKKMIVLK